MASQAYTGWIEVPGSRKAPAAGAQVGELTPPDETFEVTVRVRRRKPLPTAPPAPGRHMTHAQYEAEHGADPADIRAVEDFAKNFGLKVKATLPAERSILLEGTAAAFCKAYQVVLRTHRLADDTWYRGREGTISIPKELEGIVVGVFGLDNRQVCWPQFRCGPMRRETAATAAGARTAAGSRRPGRPRHSSRTSWRRFTTSPTATGPARRSASSSWAGVSSRKTSTPTSPRPA